MVHHPLRAVPGDRRVVATEVHASKRDANRRLTYFLGAVATVTADQTEGARLRFTQEVDAALKGETTSPEFAHWFDCIPSDPAGHNYTLTEFVADIQTVRHYRKYGLLMRLAGREADTVIRLRESVFARLNPPAAAAEVPAAAKAPDTEELAPDNTAYFMECAERLSQALFDGALESAPQIDGVGNIEYSLTPALFATFQNLPRNLSQYFILNQDTHTLTVKANDADKVEECLTEFRDFATEIPALLLQIDPNSNLCACSPFTTAVPGQPSEFRLNSCLFDHPDTLSQAQFRDFLVRFEVLNPEEERALGSANTQFSLKLEKVASLRKQLRQIVKLNQGITAQMHSLFSREVSIFWNRWFSRFVFVEASEEVLTPLISFSELEKMARQLTECADTRESLRSLGFAADVQMRGDVLNTAYVEMTPLRVLTPEELALYQRQMAALMPQAQVVGSETSQVRTFKIFADTEGTHPDGSHHTQNQGNTFIAHLKKRKEILNEIQQLMLKLGLVFPAAYNLDDPMLLLRRSYAFGECHKPYGLPDELDEPALLHFQAQLRTDYYELRAAQFVQEEAEAARAAEETDEPAPPPLPAAVSSVVFFDVSTRTVCGANVVAIESARRALLHPGVPSPFTAQESLALFVPTQTATSKSVSEEECMREVNELIDPRTPTFIVGEMTLVQIQRAEAYLKQQDWYLNATSEAQIGFANYFKRLRHTLGLLPDSTAPQFIRLSWVYFAKLLYFMDSPEIPEKNKQDALAGFASEKFNLCAESIPERMQAYITLLLANTKYCDLYATQRNYLLESFLIKFAEMRSAAHCLRPEWQDGSWVYVRREHLAPVHDDYEAHLKPWFANVVAAELGFETSFCSKTDPYAQHDEYCAQYYLDERYFDQDYGIRYRRTTLKLADVLSAFRAFVKQYYETPEASEVVRRLSGRLRPFVDVTALNPANHREIDSVCSLLGMNTEEKSSYYSADFQRLSPQLLLDLPCLTRRHLARLEYCVDPLSATPWSDQYVAKNRVAIRSALTAANRKGTRWQRFGFGVARWFCSKDTQRKMLIRRYERAAAAAAA